MSSRDLCIHELFERQVERSPEAIAVIAGAEQLTYRQLDERANRVAHFLIGRGIGPDALVGLFIDRSLDMVAALLGILKAGGAYSPVDPSYPDARIRHVFDDTATTILLTQESLVERLSSIAPELPAIVLETQDLSAYPVTRPRVAVLPQNLAYVMYTSGSTGGPKGVAIPHSAVRRLVIDTNFTQLDETKCLLSAAPIAFDASTFEIWGALLNGGRVALLTERIPTPQAIAALTARHAIDTAWLTSSLFNSILDVAPDSLANIRQLLVGGEALSVRHVALANRTLKNTQLINGYGPTESTTFACTWAIPRSFDETSGSVPIGTPIANTTVFIVDDAFERVPDGEIGELLIGGEGLARCYLNRPELTAEKFVPSPFGGAGERLYRTGDQVRLLPSGEIEFIGRADDQVKIRGFRIELGEIEIAVSQHPAILQTAVIVREDVPGAKRIVAYVVARPGHTVTGRELRAFLSETLPEYMVPAQVVFLDEMPLSPTGKTDRRALPVPPAATADVTPRTELELVVANVAAEVLGTPVSIGASFMELGGSSLNASRMIATLREQAAVELPMRLLLGDHTLQEIAAELERNRETQAVAIFDKLPRDGRLLPPSFPQERVWFVQNMDPQNLAYQFTATIRFNGRLDVNALAIALTRIVERHEIYRTSFHGVDGHLFQAIHEPWRVELEVMDDRPLADVVREQSHRPFDLAALPLVRWTLWRRSETEHVLVMVEHHIVHDGWSFNVFQKELTEIYRSITEGTEARIHPEPLQYADFAAWQRQWIESDEARKQLDFWSAKLAGVPPLLGLVQDRARPAIQTYAGACPRVEIDEALFDDVTVAARQSQTTVFMLFTAAFQLLMHRYSGQEDFCIGTGIANRRWAETSDLMGMLVNNIGLRVQTCADMTVAEVIENVKKTALEAYANQDVPFDQVVQAVRPPRDMSHNPIYQVMLSFHDSPLQCASLAGLSLEVEPGLSNGAAKFDLNIVVVAPQKHQRRAKLLWEYNTDLFDAAFIERMVADYFEILGEVARADSGARVERRHPAGRYAGFQPAGKMPAERPAGSRRYTATEEILTGIWKTVLRAERIGRHDDFFELGGHSLLAMQIISRIHSALGVDLPARALFEAPTVAELAARLAEAGIGAQGSRSRIPALVRRDQDAPLPLSFAQQRLWFLQQLDPEGFQYNVRVYLRLTGALDEAALELALGEIVRRHEVLRTTFAVDVAPVVHDVPQTLLDKITVTDEQKLQALIAAEARRPFDLVRGPVLRAVLARRDAEHHVLLVTMHHVVADGWSLDVFARELSALYSGAALEPLPVQYSDYAAWQQDWMRGDVLEGQLAYWRQQLEGVPVLDLPTVHPRPAIPTHAGTRRHFTLSPDVVDPLRELSRQEGVTLFMTLLAAFNVLLRRYTGQDDVAVGTPIAGRTAKETEALIGFFVNTLVLRTDLSGAPTVRELLARVRETALQAYGNQDVPFEKLVDELQPERDMSRTPLFQVLFALQNAPEAAWSLRGLDVSKETVATESEKFDLSLIVEESNGGLKAAIGYQTDLFDAPFVERLTRHLQQLLAEIVRNPDARIDALPLLSADETKQVVELWNDTAHDYPRTATIHQMFEEQVRRTPDRIAVVDGTKQFTFAELNRQANRLAHHLRRHGVEPDMPVGLCVERCAEMIAGLLGILKAGGAYVPLDPHSPIERLQYVIEDAGIRVLLGEEEIREILAGDDDRFDANLDVAMHPENLAYVIFTSGSTGRPKGVAIQHRSVLNLETALREQIPVPRTRVAMNAPLVFDASVKQWIQLLNGATLVVVPEEVRQSGAALLAFIESEQLDYVDCTPSHLQVLLDLGLLEKQLATTFLIGGEKIGEPMWRRLGASPVTRFYNVYGPTECTVDAALTAVGGESVPVIGRPLLNARLYVLDEAMQPVPAGVRGELYIGGAGVARGYVNRADLTAERFVPNPFKANGERLYRTGDAVRWRDDGSIEYLDRIDHQVKLRGFRIELGEIETVLAQHPDVLQAVVLVREDRLVAFLKGEAKDVRAFLEPRLPDYMIPSAFVALDELPLTVNGKVDRRKLLAIELDTTAPADTFVAPRTPVEMILADILADVLDLEQVGVNDDFFALGGHSLLAMQLVSRITKILKIEVPLRFLFLAPTVARMADLLLAQPGSAQVLRIAARYEEMQLAAEGTRS